MTFKKMNPTVKKGWVKALLSGHYFQTQEYLCVSGPAYAKRASNFCCLGVLYDSQVEGDWVDMGGGHWLPSANALLENEKACLAEEYLPAQVADKIGLSRAAQEKVARMNDLDGKTFIQIAHWIEKNL